MSIETRFMLCAMAALLLMELPAAAESWVIQSISQEITEASGSDNVQSSIQLAGVPECDVIIQDIIQQPNRINAESADALAVYQIDMPLAHRYNNDDLDKINEKLKRWDASDVAYCSIDLQAIEGIKDNLDCSLDYELEKIPDDDLNFSRRVFAQANLLLSNQRCNFEVASDNCFHILFSSNGAWQIILCQSNLGESVEGEEDTLSDPDSSEDDDFNQDGEDGVIFIDEPIYGKKARIMVTTSKPEFFNAWIDIIGDECWRDDKEMIFAAWEIEKGESFLH